MNVLVNINWYCVHNRMLVGIMADIFPVLNPSFKLEKKKSLPNLYAFVVSMAIIA